MYRDSTFADTVAASPARRHHLPDLVPAAPFCLSARRWPVPRQRLRSGARYKIQMAAAVERPGEEIFIYNVVVGGIHLGRMGHTFGNVPGGTRSGHFQYIPAAPMPALGTWLPLFWHPTRQRKRLKHANEEMGNLHNFLPQLYERKAGGTGTVKARLP